MINILLVDDQALVRTGFRLILERAPDMRVVGEAGDGAQAVAMTIELRPDVVLMDIRMPEVDGVEATRRICRAVAAARTRVLVLTTFDLDEYVYSALLVGASGFLLKDTLAPELLSAVRAVARGDAVAAPSVTRRLLERYVATAPARTEPPDRARDRSARAHRPRSVQRGDRRPPPPDLRHRQDPCQPGTGQAGAARPRPGRRPRLRARAGPAR